jgi:hypothetical protein
MQAFKTLSYRDKFRVSRSLMRGEAPSDPEMTAAAIELAEKYQRQNRENLGLLRWGPVALGIAFVALSIWAATTGDLLNATFWALIALGNLGQLLLNPLTQPKNVARALAASRRVVKSDESLTE